MLHGTWGKAPKPGWLSRTMLLEKCEIELEQDHRAQRLQEHARLSFEKLCAFHDVSDRCDITRCCGGLDIFVPNSICWFRAHFG